MKKIFLLLILLLCSCTNTPTIKDNTNIIGHLSIPNILETDIVQSNNNTYYLNHNMNNEEDINGSIFMDYRVNIKNKKVLIYGHSGNNNNLPFLVLNKYTNKDFFNKNNTIYIYTNNKTYIYKVFSSYIETKDFDYMNLNNFNNLSYLEHINKLKDKSLFTTNIELKEEDHILILQTCSTNKSIKSKTKYQLVVAKLEKESNNS